MYQFKIQLRHSARPQVAGVRLASTVATHVVIISGRRLSGLGHNFSPPTQGARDILRKLSGSLMIELFHVSFHHGSFFSPCQRRRPLKSSINLSANLAGFLVAEQLAQSRQLVAAKS